MKSTTLVLALAVFFLGTCSARRIGGPEPDLGAGLRHEAGAERFKLNEIPSQFDQDLELKTHRYTIQQPYSRTAMGEKE